MLCEPSKNKNTAIVQNQWILRKRMDWSISRINLFPALSLYTIQPNISKHFIVGDALPAKQNYILITDSNHIVSCSWAWLFFRLVAYRDESNSALWLIDFKLIKMLVRSHDSILILILSTKDKYFLVTNCKLRANEVERSIFHILKLDPLSIDK